MTLTNKLVEAFKQVQDRIASLAQTNHRSAQEISLLAVSKSQTAGAIKTLHDATQHRDFGENYAQELLQKAQALDGHALRWHFIGALQSNKIAKLVAVCHRIDSVASYDHAAIIAKAARKIGREPFPIGLLINVASESQKAGLNFDDAKNLCRRISQDFATSLSVDLLMAIPPAHYQDDPGGAAVSVPNCYVELKSLANELTDGKLSLGMSGDLGIAIAAGTTMVRVGTAIFGERPTSPNKESIT